MRPSVMGSSAAKRCFATVLTALLVIPFAAHAAPGKSLESVRFMIEEGRPGPVRQYFSQHAAQINSNFIDGSSPLYVAVQAKQLEVAGVLIGLHADVNLQNRDLKAPLYAATKEDLPQMAELLLAHGADIGAKNTRKPRQALDAAVEMGLADMAALLIRHGANVSAISSSGRTPLDLALGENNKAMIDLLLGAGADSIGIPLEVAADLGEADVVRKLDARDSGLHQATPLRCKALSRAGGRDADNTEVMQILIDDGADIAACEAKGAQVLQLTAMTGAPENVSFLLAHGANAEVDPSVASKLLSSARHGRSLQALADAGMKFEVKDELREAIRNGRAENVEFLIAHGANVDRQSEHGEVPLIEAINAGNPQIVAILLEHHANVDVMESRNVQNALELAVFLNRIEMVRLLVRYGATVDSLDDNGYAVLQFAKSKDVYEFLTENGAAWPMKAEKLWGNLQDAIQAGDLDLVRYIVTHTVDVNAVDEHGTPLIETVRRDEVRDLLIGLGATQPAETGDKAMRMRDAKACRMVADRANEGTLDALKLAFAKPEGKVAEMLRTHQLQGLVASINLPGSAIRYAVLGKARVARDDEITFLSADGKPVDVRSQEGYGWQTHAGDDHLRMALLKIDGLVYTLWFNKHRLEYLTRVRRDNVEVQLCAFDSREPAIEVLLQSKDAELCQAALAGKLNYAGEHLPSGEIQKTHGGHPVHVSEGRFIVDINNDGVSRLVLQESLGSPVSYSPCDSRQLFVMEEDLSSRNQALSDKLRTGGCSASSEIPFIYQGHTYTEGKYDAKDIENYHQVRYLHDGQMETICKFDVRPTQTALMGGWYMHPGENYTSGAIENALSLPDLGVLSDYLDEGGLEQSKLTLRQMNRTVIDQAIIDGQDHALEMILAHGFNPNSAFGVAEPKPDEGLDPPLFTALRFGTPRSVQLLLDNGAAIGAGEGGTGVFHLTGGQNWERRKFELFLQHGADPEKMIWEFLQYNFGSKCPQLAGGDIDAQRQAELRSAENLVEDGGLDRDALDHYIVLLKACGETQKRVLLETALAYAFPQHCGINVSADDLPCLAQRLRKAQHELADHFGFLSDKNAAKPAQALQDKGDAWLKRRDEQCHIAYPWKDRAGWLPYALGRPKQALCALQVSEKEIAAW